MPAETNKLLVRRLVDEAQCRGNLEVVDELLAEDFVDHSPFPGLPPTRDGVKMLFGYLRSVFPDLQVNIHEQIADDEKVVTRKTFAGTHQAEFMGAPPSGRPVSFEVIDILTVRDGRIREHRVVFDSLAIQAQLTA
ncbi:MAG TPA: ester cyclase [Thermoanaerobaculia bacterium]|nr:ester cyclase [Thermoanaerobaculia bacterium]